jgi:hypothetical protein
LLQPLAGLALAATVAAVVAFKPSAPEVVQAQRLELVNPDGKVQAALSADSGGVVLTLFDKAGRAAGSLRLNTDPRLVVLDGAGRELAGLGAPRVQHLVQ